MDIADGKAGRCWGCDYSLAQIDSRRCPECGRAFDPADERSINYGRPVGGVLRWMTRGVGWPTLLAAVIGLGGVAGATRWPATGWRLAWVDVPHYFAPHDWPARARGFDAMDWAYVGGVAIVALALAWGFVRLLLMQFARLRWRQTRLPALSRRGFGWAGALILVAAWAGWL